MSLSQIKGRFRDRGLSLIELVIAVAISAIIMVSISGVIGQALEAERVVRAQNDIHRQSRFAMEQMVQAVSRSQRLLVPLAENPTTVWNESVRDPGVLAVTLDPALDRDKDGFADADNDKDGLIDEDISADATNDFQAGIMGIDDDNDGSVDESSANDDDEDGVSLEDPVNGLDDDGDGTIDEDTDDDMNQDGLPGVGGVDDDGDTAIDEGSNTDDDEDGFQDEDWYDPVVFFLSGTTLMQRIPNLNPTDGTDYSEYPIAQNVSQFIVERLPRESKRAVLVKLSLQLTGTNGETALLVTEVRVGGAL